jgi:histone-lysine N-methyltransferase SETMAR
MMDWKVMMILAVQGHKVIAHNILPKGEPVDGQRFRRFLIESLRPKLIQAGIQHPVILMDNARPHYHHIVTEYLQRRDWDVLDHPPYSPDMNPCDFDAIHRIKRGLKGIVFPSPAMLVAAYNSRIRELNESDNFIGIYNLPNQWNNIVASNGSYIV